MPDPDDLLALCGVSLPEPKAPRTKLVECGQTPPREKPARFTEWSNLHTFTFGGYAARVDRYTCTCCENIWDTLEGVFIVELHHSGTRRLTQCGRGSQFPMGMGYPKEVTEHEVEMCGNCIGDLGFSREVDSSGQPYTLIQGKGKVR